MKKSIVTVDSGVCGHTTTIKVSSNDMLEATLEMETTCPNIIKMAEEIKFLNPLEEIDAKGQNRKIKQSFEKHGKHAACPVPAGMVKAVEVAAGLALPKDAVIKVFED